MISFDPNELLYRDSEEAVFIDLHNHILPGIDDGAESLDESREMIAYYLDLGFSTVVATPHITVDTIATRSAAANRLLTELKSASPETDLVIARAGELRLTPDVPAVAEHLLRYTINKSRYLLVDFSTGQWPFYAEDALFQTQTLGYTPILAHPERYGWAEEDVEVATRLVERGVVIQVTLSSLVGVFGTRVQRSSRRLLEAGLVHVLATDAHGMDGRFRGAGEAITWLDNTFGDELTSRFLEDNPHAILRNDDLETVALPRKVARTYSFAWAKRLESRVRRLRRSVSRT